MGFGLKILEVRLLYPRHGLIIIQVLTHLHVLRIAHEEGVRCCDGFLQLVYLRMKHRQCNSHMQTLRFVSKCAVHSKQEISVFLNLLLSVPQPLPGSENTPMAGMTQQRLGAQGPGQIFSYFPNQAQGFPELQEVTLQQCEHSVLKQRLYCRGNTVEN